MSYTPAYESAVNHAMLYEVGAAWNLNNPGAKEGWIDTLEHRKACGYVNDSTDRGGETKYGVAKNANPDLNITTLDWEGAKRIYYKRYWLQGDCQVMPGRLAALHFDICVNHGIGRAAKFLQRAVGAEADGDIGPATLALVSKFDEFDICRNICDQREAFYATIIQNNPSQIKYQKGWTRRANDLRNFATNPANTFQ